MKYVVGIDGGSQSSKVTIYDIEGNEICSGQEQLKPMYIADPLIAEHPDDDLWDSIAVASKKALAKFPFDLNDIIGIGVGSIRCCRVLLKKDGNLASPSISWMDARVSSPYVHENDEVAYVTSTTGYIISRLTNNFIDSIGNFLGQWPVDFEKRTWSEDASVIEQYQIPREMLFDVCEPGEIVGSITEFASQLTGFPVGVPVVVTTSDQAVGALGVGLTDESGAVISLGTYISLMVLGHETVENKESYWHMISSIPNEYIYEGVGIRKGMWTISWIIDLLGKEISEKAKSMNISAEEYLNHIASSVSPGCEGLMSVLEWLAPPTEPYKRGIMIGFNANTGAAHMYRSILEGIAMTMKNNISALENEMGRKIESVTIAGGGSKSDLFMQIFADVFNIPTKRIIANSAAGLGAAINTAVALGVYPSYDDAIKSMVKVRDVFYPEEKNVSIYNDLIKVYNKITNYTDEILKESHEILNKI